LQELAHIRDAIFRERTGVNRDRKQKEASAEQTRRAAPAVVPDDHASIIELLEAEVTSADNRITREIADVKNQHEQEQEGIERARKDAWKDIDRSVADRSSELNAAAESEIAQIRARVDSEIEEMRATAQVEKEDALDTASVETQGVKDRESNALFQLFEDQKAVEADRVKLSELREQAKVATKAATRHEQAERFDEEASELEELSDRMAAAIEALDKYRRGLADNLPIEGLEVEGKEIKVYGVPFDQLNTAQRIAVAVRVACIRARDQRLPVVWVDGAEALDSENFAALKAALKEEGVQPFIGRVEDTELTVTAE
jgi:hypothetical protein